MAESILRIGFTLKAGKSFLLQIYFVFGVFFLKYVNLAWQSGNTAPALSYSADGHDHEGK